MSVEFKVSEENVGYALDQLKKLHYESRITPEAYQFVVDRISEDYYDNDSLEAIADADPDYVVELLRL